MIPKQKCTEDPIRLPWRSSFCEVSFNFFCKIVPSQMLDRMLNTHPKTCITFCEQVYKHGCFSDVYHCVKSVRIWSFSGSYFPTCGLNTEKLEVYFTQCICFSKYWCYNWKSVIVMCLVSADMKNCNLGYMG